ncbi:MAG: hypothetical protein ACI8PG_001593 [Planctomycetota bacterium]
MSRARAVRTIAERANFDTPYRYAQGIDYVLTNEQMAMEKSELADVRADKRL